MFVVSATLLNRESELARLEQAWDAATRGEPQFAVIWGRRRVGKTFLLSHFVRAKRSVFFGATQQAEPIELARLHESTRRGLGSEVTDLTGGVFSSWEGALRFFAGLAAKEPLVVVVDEAPYLARSTPGFASIVQTVWDGLRGGTKLFLVLTGSAVSTVESMLGAGAPLRGRPTLRLRLDPLDPWAARVFLPGLSPVRSIEAYAACGGYPLHLLAWDRHLTTEENLLHLAGTPGGILIEDAAGILHEELSDLSGYSRIFAAIGTGLTRYSEIASAAGQRIEYPLEVLSRAGFVRKSLPLGAPKGARPNYEVSDPYLLFWFRVLYSDIALIEGGQGKAVLRRATPRWQTHLGVVFEEIARQHAGRLVTRGHLPEDLVIGRWWATTGPACEVDVLGLRGRRTYLLGEARWQEAPVRGRDLEALRRKASRVPEPVAEPLYVFWGRTKGAREVRQAGALSYDIAAMFRESTVNRPGAGGRGRSRPRTAPTSA